MLSIATMSTPAQQATLDRATTFGPAPATVFDPKSYTPEGARYCEQVNAFIPADMSYRVRGIRKMAVPEKKTLVARLFKSTKKTDDSSVVLAMGISHARMHLVSLADAQADADIKYRGIDTPAVPALPKRAVQGDREVPLIPLWEAQARPDVRYRWVLAPKAEQKKADAAWDAAHPERRPVKELPKEWRSLNGETGSKTIVPPLPAVDGRVKA